MLLEDYKKRHNSLTQEAKNWQPAWQELSDYINPTRGFFNQNIKRGTLINHKKLIKSSAGYACRTLASGMTSGLTSPSRPWFKLTLQDPELSAYDPVKIWLADAESRMYAIFARSNIYRTFHNMYTELGTFGTACGILLSNQKSVIQSRYFTCGEYALGVGKDGMVDSFARIYWMSVKSLVDEFGIDNVCATTKSAYLNKQYDTNIQVYHLIQPNMDKDNSKDDNKNMAFESIYWEVSANKPLRESGYHEFPVIAPRWQTITSIDPYGYGPGHDAMGDIKSLQQMQKDLLIQVKKVGEPPMQAAANVIVNTFPNGITRNSGTNPDAGVRPAYQINPDINSLKGLIYDTIADIRTAFYADLFMMLSNNAGPQQTAREVVEKHEEKLLMLGPVLEMLEDEMLDPVVNRTFNEMMRNNLLPPPPKVLEGKDISVEYISILAQAQKMSETLAMEQSMAFMGNMAAAFPEVLDNVNPDDTYRNHADIVGMNPKNLNSMEVVAQKRKQRQAAAEAQQVNQNAMNMAQGAKLLSDTPIGQGSALDGVLSAMPGAR
jgi:hypothetical protein